MRPFQRFPIEDTSQVGEARRAAQSLAAELGFDDEAAGRLALAITELGTNLVRHVGPNRACALLVGQEADSIRVLSLDQGPGMDLARCLRDGFSTGGSSGIGLGAVQRQASTFSGCSLPGRGTVLAALFAPRVERRLVPRQAPDAFRIGGLVLAAPGEQVAGDAWAVSRDGDRALLMVADGLGHGPGAAEAADKMVSLLRQQPVGSPAAFLERAHDPMRMTRGAAVTAVLMDAAAPTLQYAGAGNVIGRLISGVVDRSLLAQNGTLGMQVRRLQDMPYDWPAHAVLVLHSDGIVSRWSLADVPALLQAEPIVIAGWILRDHLRGRDDATVVVVRPPEFPTRP